LSNSLDYVFIRLKVRKVQHDNKVNNVGTSLVAECNIKYKICPILVYVSLSNRYREIDRNAMIKFTPILNQRIHQSYVENVITASHKIKSESFCQLRTVVLTRPQVPRPRPAENNGIIMPPPLIGGA